jgi:NADPH2:quinone reductase
MRAAEIHTPGQPPEVVERAAPEPGDGVVVEVAAAPIVPLDLLCASGRSYFGVPHTPYVPGVQGVGTLEGRPVWFATSAGMAPGDGSMSELAAVARDDVVTLPDGVDPVAMAALGLSGVAAHQALTWRGELEVGETVLVLGGGGVVGQAAIQVARLHGAGRVVAAARSVGGQQRAWGAGADAVVVLDTDDVGALSGRFTEAAGGGVDLVLDPLYGVPAAAAARALRPGGRLVNLGSSAHEHAPIDSSTLRSKSLRLLGYTNNELSTQRRAEAVAAVASYSAQGKLTVAREVLPLSSVAEAWQRQAEGRTSGRIVLTMG